MKLKQIANYYLKPLLVALFVFGVQAGLSRLGIVDVDASMLEQMGLSLVCAFFAMMENRLDKRRLLTKRYKS